MIHWPSTGTIVAPRGTSTESDGPIATMCPCASSMTALSITAPVPSNTVAPTYAVVPLPGPAHATRTAIAATAFLDVFMLRRRDFLVRAGERISRPRLSKPAEALEAGEWVTHGEDLIASLARLDLCFHERQQRAEVVAEPR